jgi:hypothetical protein
VTIPRPQKSAQADRTVQHFLPVNRTGEQISCWFTLGFDIKRDAHTRSGPGVGLSSGPSGIESIGAKVISSSTESSRIPMFGVGELGTSYRSEE